MFSRNKVGLSITFALLSWSSVCATPAGRQLAVIASAGLNLAEQLNKDLLRANEALEAEQLRFFEAEWLRSRGEEALEEAGVRHDIFVQRVNDLVGSTCREEVDRKLQAFQDLLDKMACENREKDEALKQRRIASEVKSLPVLNLTNVSQTTPREQTLQTALQVRLTPRTPGSTPRNTRPRRARSVPVRLARF